MAPTVNLAVIVGTAPPLASKCTGETTSPAVPPLSGMEDSDDNVTFGERRAILQHEVQLDEDKPLFSAEDMRPDKAAV